MTCTNHSAALTLICFQAMPTIPSESKPRLRISICSLVARNQQLQSFPSPLLCLAALPSQMSLNPRIHQSLTPEILQSLTHLAHQSPLHKPISLNPWTLQSSLPLPIGTGYLSQGSASLLMQSLILGYNVQRQVIQR
eukprot:CAMPEP_0202351274 /NCGR_PEP_ID=MMETSP1126-20121109/7988_1 /ASSEMBLY_ACC=CAM_ASM_000457 /TAXON_ID=3047 /ORGANISM="Dunaliella tertiolecta, Strain CCMP1320" /LENGTH=136 /DNA_ID=CAMNT_0048943365 /DNA_START=738 /DNA_END=1148 /DNA_ORIENTATION=+